ncbi:glycosyl transferase [Haloferax elongans ATCC BAA-1513]|uniref:Glycosyl transferase n=1 Tax=Haloferax elongans ATCC BAA-1513 TaxID=1230453 RepID=M0I2A1_HALEO|nr:glycosyltransferase family A protein [Haloferax elongans]ELZ89499.1 glycosyl transferase [Haloferax elongans ATCC BAA-1513]
MKTIDAIVTTYYRNEYLKTAIESLLASKGVVVEVYVVDMSCERHAEEVVREYDVNYVPIQSYDTDHTLKQIAKARDIGVALSTEDYVFFLDDDDTVTPDGLSKLVNSLNGQCGVAFGMPDSLLSPEMIKPFYTNENPLNPERLRSFMLGLLTTPLSTCAMVVERESIESIPPIASLPHDDIATVFELSTTTNIATIDEVIVHSQQKEPDAGLSKESLYGQANIFTEYQDYYDEIPTEFRLTDRQYEAAKSEYHRYKAMAALSDRYWSSSAIYQYYNSAKTRPYGITYGYLRFLASLFGSLGLFLFAKIQGKKVA